MDDLQCIAEIRLCIGDPTPNEVSPETLAKFWARGLERLAQDLECLIPPPTQFTLPEGEYSLPLPDDCMRLLWVENVDLQGRLVPDSPSRWTRDGLNFRTSTAGTPGRYCQQGRQLWINPAPSSDFDLILSYIAHSPGLQPHGVTGLTDPDLMVACRDAAVEFLGLFPGKDDAARKKSADLIVTNNVFYQRELLKAKVRWEKPAVFSETQLSPSWRRSWAAR